MEIGELTENKLHFEGRITWTDCGSWSKPKRLWVKIIRVPATTGINFFLYWILRVIKAAQVHYAITWTWNGCKHFVSFYFVEKRAVTLKASKRIEIVVQVSRDFRQNGRRVKEKITNIEKHLRVFWTHSHFVFDCVKLFGCKYHCAMDPG